VSGNFVELILRHAETRPDHPALVLPGAWDDGRVTASETLTFGELAERVGRRQAGLAREELREDDRVVLMFGMGAELYVTFLALLAAGMPVVLIDGGMGGRRILGAIARSGARAVVGVHALLKHRFWAPALWGRRRYCTDGAGLGLRAFAHLDGESLPPVPVERGPDDHALITFTSGSTGRPKGADRTHGLLTAQHEALAEHFPEEPDEVDMPCFPVVTLHNLCCGITTVLPPVDFASVGAAPAEAVWSFAAEHGVTRMSGAPAYVERLIAALEAGTPAPPTLRALGIGGARVPVALSRRVLAALPDVESKVLYGSTEAEPIASASLAEVVALGEEHEAGGVLVGTPASMADVRLVELPDPPPLLDERGVAPFCVPDGETGELVVSGPHVNKGYLDDPEANRENKLPMPDGSVWHRTGDVAWRDEQGRLLLVGRVKDAVRVGDRMIQPFVLESTLEQTPGVERAALVDAGGPKVAAAPDGTVEPATLEASLAAALADRDLAGVQVHVVEAIPVDRRHNSKIDRPTLRRLLGG